MQAVLAGERADYIPAWPMGFFNAAVVRGIAAAHLLVADLNYYPENTGYGFAPHPPAELDRLIAFNQYIDRGPAVGVGWGANFAFGHAGPGEFNSRGPSSAPQRAASSNTRPEHASRTTSCPISRTPSAGR